MSRRPGAPAPALKSLRVWTLVVSAAVADVKNVDGRAVDGEENAPGRSSPVQELPDLAQEDMNDSQASYRVGVDVGGTFTDLIAYGAGGVLHSAKVPSLPGEQWRGVLDALASLGVEPASIRAFVHGTTIATNALLERKGATTGLVTTEGFRDLLEIGKGRRLVGGLFDPEWQRPAPLVPRDRRLEVPERIAADGSVVRPLDGADFDALAAALGAKGVEAVAVALLNSYVDDAHEQTVARELASRLPEAAICASAELTPERGEFERTSTAVLNAYLTPVMRAYLTALRKALHDRDIAAPVNIMGSNGGAMTLAAAADRCAGTFLSGPVGGVTGAVRVAASAGVEDIITFDMGGTSTDVALVHGLAPRMSHDNQIDAWPLKMPQLDIHTIGAGGGSIVWVQDDGTLGVGPRSAGAVPGPACYGRGATEPTVSDANLLLGRLPVGRALSGGLVLDAENARAAFRTLAARVGGDSDLVDGRSGEMDPATQALHAHGDGNDGLVTLASASLQIAVAKMAGAVREVSVHRGFDPRDFTLLGFGGAGPMHAMAVAEELGISRVLVPRFPGHLSALGQMLADLRRDAVTAWGGRVTEIAIRCAEGTHGRDARRRRREARGGRHARRPPAPRVHPRRTLRRSVLHAADPLESGGHRLDAAPRRVRRAARGDVRLRGPRQRRRDRQRAARLHRRGRQARGGLRTGRERRPRHRAPAGVVQGVVRDAGGRPGAPRGRLARRGTGNRRGGGWNHGGAARLDGGGGCERRPDMRGERSLVGGGEVQGVSSRGLAPGGHRHGGRHSEHPAPRFRGHRRPGAGLGVLRLGDAPSRREPDDELPVCGGLRQAVPGVLDREAARRGERRRRKRHARLLHRAVPRSGGRVPCGRTRSGRSGRGGSRVHGPTTARDTTAPSCATPTDTR